ncbi:MAG: hypothetical protein NTV88_05885 [Candidatus Micrarchaeota archaeon]|nr:hypothetical protein [Candidatus Micrarchaeota archaeon]
MAKESKAQVVLIALALFLFGVGGLFALSSKLVQAAKSQPSQTWSPVAVTSSVGSERLYDDFMRDSILMHVKNQDTRTIVIKGVSAGGTPDMLMFGTESINMWGHPVVEGDGCDPSHNAAKQCSIPIAPGAEIPLQLYVQNGVLCNRDFTENPYSPPSINSVRKSASSYVTVYYQYSGAVPMPVADSASAPPASNTAKKAASVISTASALVKTIGSQATQPNTGTIYSKSFSLTVKCIDFWMCQPDEYWSSNCINRYETNKAHWCVKGGCGYSFVG